ncbi:MAG: hypothetical protein JO057_25055, partial [Chloroflexi bacterium]|nr:hypothetical protein [Chloroflexota bacterium]
RLEDRFALLRRIGGRGGSPRQQTLRATIEWSYNLLEPAEQQLFRRLAVFAGPFDLPAAQAMGGPATLDVLGRLVDKSLVVAQARQNTTLYRLLDTLRPYAWEQLEAAGEVELARERHLEHILGRAEELFIPTETVDGPTWALDRDLDDLRSALEWCRVANPQAGLRLMAATQNVWWRRSCAEGRRWATVFLDCCPEPNLARAQTLHTAGRLEVYADPAKGRRLLTEGHALAASLGDRVTEGMLDGHLGMAAFAQGDTAAGLEYFARGIQIMEELGDVRASTRMRSYLAWIMLADDARREEAREQLERAHRVADELGDRWITGIADFGLGLYWRRMGKPQRALQQFLRTITVLQSLEEVPLLCEALLQVARLIAASQPVRAAELASAALAIAGRAGVYFQPRVLRRVEQLRTDLGGRLGCAQSEWAWAKGERMSVDEAVALVLSEGQEASTGPGGLSARELEIARLVARGLTSRQAGEILHLSTRTVDSHLGRMFNKLGLSNRLQLTAWLMRTTAEPGRDVGASVQARS